MKRNQGFTLLVAIVTTSMLLIVSFMVANIAFKQLVITYTNEESQHAFYAADSGVECAVYHDLNGPISLFDPYVSPGNISCNSQSMTPSHTAIVGGYSTSTITFNLPKGCVVVNVVKFVGAATTTKIDSRGYNTCAVGAPRKFERGVTITY